MPNTFKHQIQNRSLRFQDIHEQRVCRPFLSFHSLKTISILGSASVRRPLNFDWACCNPQEQHHVESLLQTLFQLCCASCALFGNHTESKVMGTDLTLYFKRDSRFALQLVHPFRDERVAVMYMTRNKFLQAVVDRAHILKYTPFWGMTTTGIT